MYIIFVLAYDVLPDYFLIYFYNANNRLQANRTNGLYLSIHKMWRVSDSNRFKGIVPFLTFDFRNYSVTIL